MSNQGRKYRDVFLSYSSEDEQQVQRLADRLAAQGLEVWFAPDNIYGGKEFPREIEEGLQSTRTVVTVLSSSSVQSFWVQQEWQARLIQMSIDRTRALIPLLLTDCEIPLLLKNFHHVDFRSIQFDDLGTLEPKVQELVNSIKEVLPPPGKIDLPVPFVVIAMTKSDAEELASEEFLSTEQGKDFSQLLATIGLGLPQDFAERYAETPEEWKPFLNDTTTIRDMIKTVTSWVNQVHLAKSETVIHPQFYSQDFLSLDRSIRSQIWNHLEHVGCVLVVDSISLFHPRIREFFLMSQLGVNERIALIGISPADVRFSQSTQIIEGLMSTHLQRIFDRYDQVLDPQCIFNIGDERTFSRLLYAILPKTAEIASTQRATPSMRQLLRTKLGKTPQEVHTLIYQTTE